MTFDSVSAAYRAYSSMTPATLEARAQAIRNDLASNPGADVVAYAIELEGIESVIEEKRNQQPQNVEAPAVAQTAAKPEAADDVAGSREYRAAFFHNLQGRELVDDERRAFEAVNAERRAAAFNTLGNSAAVVPTTTLDQIITKAADKGGILSIARRFAVPANISVPIATPTSAAQWHAEGAQVDSEKVDTVTVDFGAYEIMKVLSISAAAQRMTVDAFEAFLVDELANSIMATLASAMVGGDGDRKATGIVAGITWDESNTVTTSEITYHDVLNTVATLHRGYSQGAKFVMNNRTLYKSVYSLHDDNDRPIYLDNLVSGGPGRLLGFDVTIDDFMADNDVIFGNFNYYGVNMPQGISLDMSRESSFSRGLVDYRGLCIADAKPLLADAFARLTIGA